jgi:hypothetical protein
VQRFQKRVKHMPLLEYPNETDEPLDRLELWHGETDHQEATQMGVRCPIVVYRANVNRYIDSTGCVTVVRAR